MCGKSDIFFINAAACATRLMSGNWHGHKLISNEQSSVWLCRERGQHTPAERVVPAAVSEGREFRAVVICWVVWVRGGSVSVCDIVWKGQLANGPLPREGVCSPGFPSELTAKRNWSCYLMFPKQEAAKPRKQLIHFPVTMVLLLHLLGGCEGFFRGQ